MLLLVTGADRVRIRERTKDLVDHFVGKYDPTRLNVEICTADDDFAVIREKILSAPFLAEKRLVILLDILQSCNKAERQQWTGLLQTIPDSTVILAADLVSESNEGSWVLEVVPTAKAFPLRAFTPAERLAWLKDRAKQRTLSLDSEAWSKFVAYLGEDLSRALLELDKLAAYAGAEVVTKDMVALLVAPTVINNEPFALSNALQERPRSALGVLTLERWRGVAEQALFGSLLRSLRLHVQTKAILRQPTGDPAKLLGLHPFVFKKETQAVHRLVWPNLLKNWQEALVLDRSLKRGLSPALAVDRLLAELMQEV